ncbi:hypothetical protein [Cryptosporangium arvum]|uniref:hypothetical protein n=1 Tax=Cryptosporangium arvum TaxID=80871 RepID=UPI0004B2E7A7|nr:hypothetical protein [Cryptosporangium arvum]
MATHATAAHREGLDSGTWRSVTEALDESTTNRVTGALHVDGPVSGSIYLIDGEVYYVHTPAAPGVDCLLQASGTVPAAAFQSAWTTGAAGGQVGDVLIKSGALSRGEAELCTAAAITDGAYALLTAAPAETGPVRYAAGEGHWWGPVRRVGGAALDVQIRKRKRLLERTPPGNVDDQPVVAAGRLGRHHVVLTDLQWELIVHANGRRSPRELARLLGRSAFSAILESRRLITAGLIQVVRPEPAPRPAAPETAARPTSAPEVSSATEPAPADGADGPPEGWRNGLRAAGRGRRRPELPARKPELPTRRPDPAHPMPLPRRQPGAALRGVVPVPPPRAEKPREPSVLDVPEPDHSLLTRVRNALEGLR